MSVRTVFMGSDSFSVPVLDALIRHGVELPGPVEVVGVVTQPDRPAGRGRKMAESPTKVLARGAGLTVLQPERLRRPEELERLLTLSPELIVVASFGQILPPRLLDAPEYRCLNLHPSLLPRYRGPSPISTPILVGDTTTGTSLMLMSPGMDEGPILAQDTTAIGDNETAGELGERLAGMSARLLLDRLPDWLDGRLEPVPQDDRLATYSRLVRKEDGEIRWTDAAVELSRLTRAFNPWPGAFTHWNGARIRLHRAGTETGTAEPGQVIELSEGALRVGTGNGLLAVVELQLAGGKRVRAEDFVRGHPGIVGARLG